MERQQKLEQLNQACQELGNRSVLMSHAVASEVGLNATDFECFDSLRMAGTHITAGQLAQATGLTTGAITGIVDRLERAGFAERCQDPADRRRVFVCPILTKCQKIMELYGPLSQNFQQLTKKYTNEQLDIIADFVKNAADMLHAETGRIRDAAESGQASKK